MIIIPLPFADAMENVGSGFSWPNVKHLIVGWLVEGMIAGDYPAGFYSGGVDIHAVQVGFSLEGPLPTNQPVGWNIRATSLFNFPTGFDASNPSDQNIGLGFMAGIVTVFSVPIGKTLMGLSAVPADFLPLDNLTMSSQAMTIPVRSQATLTLNGTDPEDLD